MCQRVPSGLNLGCHFCQPFLRRRSSPKNYIKRTVPFFLTQFVVSEFAPPSTSVLVHDLHACPSEKAVGLDLRRWKALSHQAEHVAQLVVVQIVPPSGNCEVNCRFVLLHNKSGYRTAKVR